jgi:hypothetical protein
MKIITIEEHVLTPAVARASAPTAQQLSVSEGRGGWEVAPGVPRMPA